MPIGALGVLGSYLAGDVAWEDEGRSALVPTRRKGMGLGEATRI